MHTTLFTDTLRTGDVIEIDVDADAVTALVLLATDDFAILDLCDGSTPIVVNAQELTRFRKFGPAEVLGIG